VEMVNEVVCVGGGVGEGVCGLYIKHCFAG